MNLTLIPAFNPGEGTHARMKKLSTIHQLCFPVLVIGNSIYTHIQ